MICIFLFMTYFKSPSLGSLPRLLNDKGFKSKEFKKPFWKPILDVWKPLRTEQQPKTAHLPRFSWRSWTNPVHSLGPIYCFKMMQWSRYASSFFPVVKGFTGQCVIQHFPNFLSILTASGHKTTLKWLQLSDRWHPTSSSRRDSVTNFLPWAPHNGRRCIKKIFVVWWSICFNQDIYIQ